MTEVCCGLSQAMQRTSLYTLCFGQSDVFYDQVSESRHWAIRDCYYCSAWLAASRAVRELICSGLDSIVGIGTALETATWFTALVRLLR